MKRLWAHLRRRYGMIVLATLILSSAAMPANAHTTALYPSDLPGLETQYRNAGYTTPVARCLAAAVSASRQEPSIWQASTGGGGCIGYIGTTALHGYACHSGTPCSAAGSPTWPAYSAQVGQQAIVNWYVAVGDERGGMYWSWSHEWSHNWLSKLCGGDASCGTGQAECYADYVAHYWFDASSKHYSGYRQQCTAASNPYRATWAGAYE